MREHFGCPVQATANTITGKWKALIVWYLAFRSHRFGELCGLLPGISEKVLTSQLKELARDGIVQRSDTHEMPPRVDYSLTPAGQELIPIMEAMCRWGGKHLGVQPTLPSLPALLLQTTNGAQTADLQSKSTAALFRNLTKNSQ